MTYRRSSRGVAVALLVLLGCSGCERSSSSSSVAVSAQPPNLVSVGRVAREKPGGAQRPLLSWWRAVQFRDVESALRLTDARATRSIGGVRVFRAAVREVGDSLPGLVISESVRVGRKRMAVRALITFYDDRGRTVGSAPRAFAMSRTSAGWSLHDASYLHEQALAIRRARARGTP